MQKPYKIWDIKADKRQRRRNEQQNLRISFLRNSSKIGLLINPLDEMQDKDIQVKKNKSSSINMDRENPYVSDSKSNKKEQPKLPIKRALTKDSKKDKSQRPITELDENLEFTIKNQAEPEMKLAESFTQMLEHISDENKVSVQKTSEKAKQSNGTDEKSKESLPKTKVKKEKKIKKSQGSGSLVREK